MMKRLLIILLIPTMSHAIDLTLTVPDEKADPIFTGFLRASGEQTIPATLEEKRDRVAELMADFMVESAVHHELTVAQEQARQSLKAQVESRRNELRFNAR